jgi:hypothetical protein
MITPKGERVLVVCKRASNFRDPDPDKVPQELPTPSNVGDILVALSGGEPPSISVGAQAKVPTKRRTVSLPSSRGMRAARRSRTFGERMTRSMELFALLVQIFTQSMLILVYSLIILFLLFVLYLGIRS